MCHPLWTRKDSGWERFNWFGSGGWWECLSWLKTCLTHRNDNSLLPHQRGNATSCPVHKMNWQFWWCGAFCPPQKKLICLLPLTALGSFHWGFLWGDPAREMLIYNRMQSGGGGGNPTKKNKKQTSSLQIKLVIELCCSIGAIHPRSCLSERQALIAQVHSCVSQRLLCLTVFSAAWASALGIMWLLTKRNTNYYHEA